MKLPIRYALLASGGGTTACAIIDACEEGGPLHGFIEPVCLIASKPGIGAIEKAQARGVAAYALQHKTLRDPNQMARIFDMIWKQVHFDWFGQHGWLPLTPPSIINRWPGINQHPAPVPFFGGRGMYSRAPHAAVINFARLVGRTIQTEATAQMIAPEFDQGDRIFAWPVEVSPDDTVEELQQRVLPLEHGVQIGALLQMVNYDGHPPTVPSHFELHPDERELLEKAKHLARQTYPRG